MATHEDETYSPVGVSLDALRTGSVPLAQLEEAFGPLSLGIIVVRDLPPSFIELRRKVLTYSSYLASLSQDQLRLRFSEEQLENPDVNYLVGWSLGKETLKSGQYDTLKGSYYINCGSFWHRARDDQANGSSSDGNHNMPEYTAESTWPAESVLRGFRAACEELCCMIIDTAVLVARACDRFGEENVEGYRKGCLEHVVKTSRTTKARLLHYFPSGNADRSVDGAGQDADHDDWCATHLDHGCLTGLTSAMYVDEQASPPRLASDSMPEPLSELAASPDPKAGLYMRSRSGAVTQVKIPRDCLAFQTGEALELMTKGRFKAVPHFVRGVGNVGSRGAHVARNTLAVFTQPNLGEIVDEDRRLDFGTFAKEIVAKNT